MKTLHQYTLPWVYRSPHPAPDLQGLLDVKLPEEFVALLHQLDQLTDHGLLFQLLQLRLEGVWQSCVCVCVGGGGGGGGEREGKWQFALPCAFPGNCRWRVRYSQTSTFT